MIGGVVWATDELVRVGPLTVRIVSDVPEFPAVLRFSAAVRTAVVPPGSAPPEAADAEVWCVSGTGPPPGMDPDRTARARGMLAGYYATDHFGPPVWMATSGRRILLHGPRLENVLWPYVVKYLLLRHTVDTGGLFLKAAAVAVDGRGALIVGRGGAGKTVMLTELCGRGAAFVANSHVLVHGDAMQGVTSSMRMRPGPELDRLAERGVRGSAALDPTEVVVDPVAAFGAAAGTTTLRTMLVVDHRGPGRHEIDELSADAALGVLEQFALGLNVYRLEEDLLDALGGDYRAFVAAYGAMQARLRDLVDRCRCHHLVTDVRLPANQDRLLDLLAR